jgi:TolB protein
VVVLNQTFARRYFDSTNPMGRTVKFDVLDHVPNLAPDTYFEIVGVVSDQKNAGLDSPILPAAFLPSTFLETGAHALIVKTSQSPESLSSSIRQAIWKVDPDIALSQSVRLKVRTGTIRTKEQSQRRVRNLIPIVVLNGETAVEVCRKYGINQQKINCIRRGYACYALGSVLPESVTVERPKMTFRRFVLCACFTLIAIAAGMAAAKEPSRWGFSDRVERHMLPAVTTGPFDPAWSGDGRIAFAARGDIWVIGANGDEAVAVTQGPNYYFEPAWSPDNKKIACATIDPAGKLGIATIALEGDNAEAIDTGPGVAVEPAWSQDGRSLYYVNMVSGGGRGTGGANIYRHDFASLSNALVTSGFQPTVSPDGKELAYVAPVRGQIGTGGLWVRPIAGGEARLVRYEQSEYRMKPAWTRDGKSLLYVSDEEGPNAVRIVSTEGGEPVRLTIDARDAYSPTPSPDGGHFAFVSNRSGPTVLYTVDMGGGPFPSWQAVPIRSWRPRTPTGHVRVRVLDAQRRSIPADIGVIASDGRFYAPDGGFAREIAMDGTHYFETQGESEIEVPAGPVKIEARKGFEYKPAAVTVQAHAGGTSTATIELTRLANLQAKGWYSGDPHIHDLHQGDYGLTHQTFFNELTAADLHVTNALIHMDGTHLMGRWSDLTGRPSPLSTRQYILQYAEEFRGSLGHIELLGIQHFILPLTAGDRNTPYAQPTTGGQYIDAAHAQGGIAGFPHPFVTPPNTPQQAANLIAVDAALGKGDFFDVASLSSDEIGSAEFYDRLLNCGFHLAASAGTDNFSDVALDPPPGSDRIYVHVKGPLTLASWLAGIKAGHTFGSTGPLLTLDVTGREPGDEIRLSADAPSSLHVHADALSIAPMTELDVLVNGQVAKKVNATDPLHIAFDGEVAVPQGGWVGLRAEGPASHYVTDSYAFAETTPVYVVRGGKKWTSAADAQFMAQSIDALWTRMQNAAWRSDAERDKFHAEIEKARAVYARIATQGKEQAAGGNK